MVSKGRKMSNHIESINIDKEKILDKKEIKLNPAEKAAKIAYYKIIKCVDEKHCFLVEAGAGSGTAIGKWKSAIRPGGKTRSFLTNKSL